jgi:hypothetical protein
MGFKGGYDLLWGRIVILMIKETIKEKILFVINMMM